MRKIWAQRGLAGIFKGQVATFAREGLGYGSYFLCYETLMQREMNAKGIRREEVHATHAVLYGAAAGYAVRFLLRSLRFWPWPWRDGMLTGAWTKTALVYHLPC